MLTEQKTNYLSLQQQFLIDLKKNIKQDTYKYTELDLRKKLMKEFCKER